MAGVSADLKDGITPAIRKLIAIFPDLGKEFLGRLGNRGTKYLYDELLSGQEINLQAYPTDSRGHRTVRHTVNRRGTQGKIYSYSVNLFEKGRHFKSGRRAGQSEPGRYILTRKLKAIMASRAQSDVNQIGNEVFESNFNRMGL